jgi:DNA-binding transcriptional regulator YhcF (GntR family)
MTGYRPRIRDLVLDKQSAVPLYLQLKHHILHLISSGEWKPGMSLPSVRQVAGELGLATATVQRAYGELQAQGLLVGRTGRGVYVAALAIGLPAASTTAGSALRAERGLVLRGLLAPAVAHARSVGFGEDEIVATVQAFAAGRAEELATAPRVVFVGNESDVLDKYRALLGSALGDLGVSVDTLSLAELEEDSDAALDEREPIRCLVSLVGTFADLRRLAGHRGTPLFGLVVDLTDETQQRLVDLPHDELIGVVAEERYLPSARAVLRQFLGVEERLRWAATQTRSSLRRVMRECRIVAHTLGATRAVRGLARPGTELIELQFRPNPSSIARLRAVLAADERGRPNGAASTGCVRLREANS